MRKDKSLFFVGVEVWKSQPGKASVWLFFPPPPPPPIGGKGQTQHQRAGSAPERPAPRPGAEGTAAASTKHRQRRARPLPRREQQGACQPVSASTAGPHHRLTAPTGAARCRASATAGSAKRSAACEQASAQRERSETPWILLLQFIQVVKCPVEFFCTGCPQTYPQAMESFALLGRSPWQFKDP